MLSVWVNQNQIKTTIATKTKGRLIKPPFVYSPMIVTGHKIHKRDTPQTSPQKELQNKPIKFLLRCKGMQIA
jgi:uncharacterized protein YlaI